METDKAKKIHDNLETIQHDLTKDTLLCAITKYHDLEETKEVIENGITNLGESRVQDLLKKFDEIEEPVNWHFIGHLQTNKVKYLIGKVALIQSVDSLKLLRKIDAESKKQDEITNVLIQYNLTGEEQKYGFSEDETDEWIDTAKSLKNIKIVGIMGMGPNTSDNDKIREVFRQLKQIYDKINSNVSSENINMEILSMGMSEDYPIAIEEGANLVRIGSKIFN